MLPTFLIIGAEKAGTTWLYGMLKAHPQVAMPKVKEVHYFNRLDSNLRVRDNFDRCDLSWYEAHFRHGKKAAAIGEATPLYISDEAAPARIRQVLPDVKILAMLRNPIDRAYSHYQMARAKGHFDSSFDRAVETVDPRILQRGLYGAQLDRWYDLFPAEQICVYFFETAIHAPTDLLDRVARHIGVEPLSEERIGEMKVAGDRNEAARYRSPVLYNASTRAARSLRTHPATARIADALKASGFNRLVKAANRVPAIYPPLDPPTRMRVRDYYADDVAHLLVQLGLTTSPWCDFQSPAT